MAKHVVIGVTGKKRAGKDSFAKAAADFDFKQIAFADALKQFCREVFCLNDAQLYGSLKETPIGEHRVNHPDAVHRAISELIGDCSHVYDPDAQMTYLRERILLLCGIEQMLDKSPLTLTPRQVLQFVGTDIVRDRISDQFWVMKVIRTIQASNHFRWVVTDVRFPNEGSMLVNAFDAKIVYVERPALKSRSTDSHSSETSIDQVAWNYRVTNNYYDKYLDKVRDLVQTMI